MGSAEGVNLIDVRFDASETYNTRMAGALKAVWGLTILNEDVYNHPDMIRALCLGKSFNVKGDSPEQAVVMDSDGIKDKFTSRLLKGARRVLLLGQAIYTKGQY